MLIGYYDTFIRDCMDDGWLYMSGTGVNRHLRDMDWLIDCLALVMVKRALLLQQSEKL